MKIEFTIEKLAHPEHCGDWHDKPVKWVARTTEPGYTQKFSTRKDAELWARCCRRADPLTFNGAYALFNEK